MHRSRRPGLVRRLWTRHSLLLRLLVMGVTIMACSIGATAWVASVSTTSSVEQRFNDDFSVGATIYDSVLGYAATHSTWDGVGTLVQRLSTDNSRVITLRDASGALIAGDTTATATGLVPVITVNPLAVAPFPGTSQSTLAGIDPRAVGPFRLTPDEAAAVRASADQMVACLAHYRISATTSVSYNGRTVVSITSSSPPPTAKPTTAGNLQTPPVSPGVTVTTTPPGTDIKEPQKTVVYGICEKNNPTMLTETERRASVALLGLVNGCLARSGLPGRLGGDVTLEVLNNLSPAGAGQKACYDAAARELLAGYVAPPAQLSITTKASVTIQRGLSTAAQGRIALTSLLILILTVAACFLVGSRIVRPLRAVADAAQRIGRGDRTVRVRTSDRGQIAALASAFNGMAKELDQAEDRRKVLVSDVAHELRTPLGNIRGWLEASQDGIAPLDDRLVTSLLDESLLLQRIVEDLQELSLADAGKLTFHPEPLDLADILDQVAAAHRASAENAGVTVKVNSTRPVELTADPSRLRQALGNLVANAIRYTPAGGLVMLRAERLAEQVSIEVSDTGLGISPQQLPHVFDRFWRAEQSRSRMSGGSGLGLAIARHLIEAQDGTIRVHSSPHGGGTVFTITMPVRE